MKPKKITFGEAISPIQAGRIMEAIFRVRKVQQSQSHSVNVGGSEDNVAIDSGPTLRSTRLCSKLEFLSIFQPHKLSSPVDTSVLKHISHWVRTLPRLDLSQHVKSVHSDGHSILFLQRCPWEYEGIFLLRCHGYRSDNIPHLWLRYHTFVASHFLQ